MTRKKANASLIDFVGIGAPKSGSTWISKCLEEHPEILFSSLKTRKEIHFFNIQDVWGDNSTGRMSYYDKKIEWYLNQFPEAEDGKIRGEFSVTYMSDPIAYERIYKHFPDIKIIATLRNPIDMIYSLHWFFYHGAVIELPEDFNETLDKGFFIDKGMYYKHLKKYFDLFPKENIHIVFFEDVKKDPKAEIKKIYKFLGIKSNFVPPSLEKKVNETFQTRSKFFKNLVHGFLIFTDKWQLDGLRMKIFESQMLQNIYTKLNKKFEKYPPMDKKTKARCIKIFKKDIMELEKLLGRDLSSWYKL